MVRASRLSAASLFIERWDSMKINRLQFWITPAPVPSFHAGTGSYQPCLGCPGYLAIWGILDLTQEQVETIKRQPGVFFVVEGTLMFSLAMRLWL